MNLSLQNIDALRRGEALKLTTDGIDVVVVRADLYESNREQIEYDDREMRPREAYPAILRVLDADDSDPQQYLEYMPQCGRSKPA